MHAVALAGSALPLGYNLVHHRDQCGPHQGACMKDAVTALISSGPRRAPHTQPFIYADGQPGQSHMPQDRLHHMGLILPY